MTNPVLKTPVAAKGQSDIKDATGTHGREVKRRMRSRYQKGTLQKAGNQVLVRFRVDMPDGRRVLTSEKVCDLVNGKPSLSLAEQRRRAAEIVEAAGVNNTTQIKQSVLGLRTESWMFIPLSPPNWRRSLEPERAAWYSQRRRVQPTTPATFEIVSCIRFLRKLESTKRASTPSVAIVLRGSARAACKKTSFNIGQVTATRRSRTVTASWKTISSIARWSRNKWE